METKSVTENETQFGAHGGRREVNALRYAQFGAEKYKQFGTLMFDKTAVFRRYIFATLVILAAMAVGCGGAADPDDTEAPYRSSDSGGILDEGPAASTDEPQGSPVMAAAPGIADAAPLDDAKADDRTGSDTNTDPDEDAADTTEPGSQPATSPDQGDDNPLAFLNRSDTRAMWVWSETPGAKQIVENIGGAQDELLQFAAAPHGQAQRALNRLFLEARGHSNVDRFSKARTVTYDPLLDASKQAELRNFLRRAHNQGIEVEYLDGQAIWVASDALAEVPKQICRDIVTFNKSTNDNAERFDGLHFDIEPHTVRSGPYAGLWWENRLPGGYNAEWTQRWKDIMNSCRATFDTYESETGHHLILASDVGADYAHYNKPILEFFNGPNSPVDYIGIMNYYDNRPNANGQPSFFFGDDDGSGTVSGGVEQNLALWTNVPVLFGVETGPSVIAPDWMSFYQEGYGALNQVVDQLRTEYGSTNALGIAIHHYSPNSYKDLKP